MAESVHGGAPQTQSSTKILEELILSPLLVLDTDSCTVEDPSCFFHFLNVRDLAPEILSLDYSSVA